MPSKTSARTSLTGKEMLISFTVIGTDGIALAFSEVGKAENQLLASSSGSVRFRGHCRQELLVLSISGFGRVGMWCSGCRLSEAATKLGVTRHQIRRLIKDRVLAAGQVVPGAPYQIRASDLQDEQVTATVTRKGRPCRPDLESHFPMFPDA